MKYLISYATKEPRDYTKSQKLLAMSARKYRCFDKIINYRPGAIDKSFYRDHESILSEERGSGYWLWKPYVILAALSKMKEGDVLFYCDSGARFIADPSDFLSLVSPEKPIALFKTHGHLNKAWTKKDAFVLMDCDKKEFYEMEQVAGGFQLYCKNDASLEFVREYLAFCTDRRIVTDDANTTGKNSPSFREHRHDQSILSLLAAKYSIPVYRDPSQYGNGYFEAFETSRYPQIIDHHRLNTHSFFFRLKRKIRHVLRINNDEKND